MGALEILCGVAAILVLLYYYLMSKYDFWKKRGVKGPEPILFFGNGKDVLLTKISIGTYIHQLYKEFKKEPFIGVFLQRNPALIVNDLDLVKDVLIKDFSNFIDRGVKIFEKPEPLGQHLFLLEAKRWRPLRVKLSPVFTSGKLKEMFYLILECGNGFQKYLDQVTAKDPVLDCRDITSRFTTDVIGTCVFGLNLSSLSDDESEFRRMGRKVFDTKLSNLLRNWFRDAFPWIYGNFGHYIFGTEVMDFFLNSIIGTMEYRKKNNVIRKDFLHMLMELRDNPEKIEDINLTDELLASQAFVFFVAGFETSSMTMTHVLYELALNQNVQDKLRAGIKEQIQKDNGAITYDGVKEMHYLDMVFKEALRKYPPIPFLFRQALNEYTFAGTNVTIPKEQVVWIPNYAFQMDPEIFPKPEEFNPERFTPEAEAERHPMAYLPFGDGPRNCIGSRFAMYQTKVGLIQIILNYRVEVSEKTPIPYELNTRSFIISSKKDLYVKFSRIN
ncbi:probable cytochrome P450 6a13 [Orussus abietinus]|uniref:probable cytochrome P450 6a13 n=1 Tax=Orussus abietinus TaxID=222816 RepID=UPI0006252954|nr:probable cytochrome P450 6a13 [Orussus abietinus]XP_012273883.1 probable cytochrome P450 6a13 [Orussus abietinus]XP_012273885.1 probable cytochrome P450 6a13 [Orussus abietinus]XP_012273886.1 probable cytochrome P450 6a13 [Orussus abietinus]